MKSITFMMSRIFTVAPLILVRVQNVYAALGGSATLECEVS